VSEKEEDKKDMVLEIFDSLIEKYNPNGKFQPNPKVLDFLTEDQKEIVKETIIEDFFEEFKEKCPEDLRILKEIFKKMEEI